MQLTQMATELVKATILARPLSPDEARTLLHETHTTLQGLAVSSAPATAQPQAATVPDWRSSIAKQTITCLECGEMFKQLSAHHLRVHNLNPLTYRQKYGIPRTQALASRKITAQRSEQAQRNRFWEKAHQEAKAKAAASKKASP